MTGHRGADSPSVKSARRILDPDKLRARRLELGISEHGLASALGVEPGVIRRLERNSRQNELTVNFLTDLTRALGCPLTDLLSQPEPAQLDTAQTDDVAALGAVAARMGGDPVPVDRVAELTGWGLIRTLAAVESLEQALAAAGWSLAWPGNAEFIVTAPEDRTGVAAQLVNDAVARDGLDVHRARIVLDVIDGQRRSARADRQRSPLLMHLEKAGFVSTETSGSWNEASPVQLTERAAYDLCLEIGPSRPRGHTGQANPRSSARQGASREGGHAARRQSEV